MVPGAGQAAGAAKIGKTAAKVGSKAGKLTNKPILKKPGTKVNPDGTSKTGEEQFQQITKQQQKDPKKIHSIEKTKQYRDHKLRNNTEGKTLKEIKEIYDE